MFLDLGDPECLAVQTKEREMEKAKDDPKGPEEHSSVMNRRKILNDGKKKTQFGG